MFDVCAVLHGELARPNDLEFSECLEEHRHKHCRWHATKHVKGSSYNGHYVPFG